ncbi:PepSY-associated TM helix domain-containing protein [Fictibacillus sp. S7]|uniref:PepSY-associated TM helix domain-containing protein n=1 Tax=Fictibacillus sp. S7 TaxID=2212476 RepID=UPI0010132401|nr:PepSY domain-containing protein [Fictibacillus sp. S7]RXY98895.1 PepSY domain-containing protein [Fictibacillus sp. S7]
MEAIKLVSRLENKKSREGTHSIYQTVWRWHFYAGIIFAPFLIILAFSGGVYLFKPQIENVLYKDLYYVKKASEKEITPTELVNKVKKQYPKSTVTAVKSYDDPKRTAEISIKNGELMNSVYIDPYNGKIRGSLAEEKKFTEIFKKLHSELIVGGTFANRLVELAACWGVILLGTGLYIWCPRNTQSIWGTILPLFSAKGRTFWRDMHAVPAFWLSLGILLLIATGLPWSGVMGEKINKMATSTDTGYPPFAFSYMGKPESEVTTKDVAKDVPWATENQPVPASKDGKHSLTLENVRAIASKEKIQKPYSISLPEGAKGVYTISTSNPNPMKDATLNIDQYSGKVLTDVRFHDYGIMAKLISVGIAFHQGTLFGLANQIVGLILCVGLIGIAITSYIMWRKRKPRGKLGSISPSKSKKVTTFVFFIMISMGLVMPLVGISIIVVFLLDWLILKRIKTLNAWLN